MTEQNTQHKELLDRIRATRRKETTFLFLEGLFKSMAYLALMICFFSIIELIADGDETFRGTLAAIIAAGATGLFAFYLMPIILRAGGFRNAPDEENMALRIGTIFPDIKDKLCNVIQLITKDSNKDGTSRAMALAAFSDVAVTAREKDFDAVIDKKTFRKSFWWFLSAGVLTVVVFVLFQSSLGASFGRIVDFDKSFLPPAPFTLSITPIQEKKLRGKKGVLTVKAEGEAPEKISLFIKEEQQENFDEIILKPDTLGIYTYEIPSLKHSISFFAQADWYHSEIKTETGNIIVIDRPVIRSLSGKLSFPSYTKLASRTFDEQSADITALNGSTVSINILTNKELNTAELIFEYPTESANNAIDSLTSDSISVAGIDTVRKSFKLNGKRASVSFRVSKSGTYYIKIQDRSAEFNAEPIRYGILALKDDDPSVALLEPVSDIKLSENALLPIRTAISDDYGFSSLRLNYRLIKSNYTLAEKDFTTVDIPILSEELIAEIPYLWNLKELDISDEDMYEFYMEVFDNDIVSGPKSARTNILRVRMPSLDELLQETDKDQEKVEKEMKAVLKKADEIKKDMEDLKKELRKNASKKKLNWKEKKKAEEIKKKQEELQKKVKELQKKMESMTQKMEENKTLSPETLEKYKELQKLMSEVNSPEMKKAQQRMRKALEKLTPEEMRKAMEKTEFDEERFRKSIERTLKILKRMQAEQKTDALTKRAEELIKKQEELQKKTENANPNDKQIRDELAKQQAQNQKKLEEMKKELDELEKLMKEIGDDMPKDELQKAKDELNAEETKKSMEDAQKSAKQGDFEKSQKQQQKAQQNLKKFAQQMQNMKQKMKQQISEEAKRKMKKAISDMLNLSEKQEELRKQTKSLDYNSTKFSENAKKQSQMNESLSKVAQEMMKLAEKSFAVTPRMAKEIAAAMRKMQEATKNLSERNSNKATKAQQSSMASMNKAVLSMQSMMSQMQQQGQCNNPGGQGEDGKDGTGGQQQFMEGLQQMAMQQQGLNQAMQQMQKGKGGKLSPEQQGEMKRMASQQGRIQKSMEQLANEQKNSGSSGKKTLGSLQKIAEEMKKTVEDLQRGSITSETLKRQDKILSRLLDAPRSIHERDKDKRRESEEGEKYSRKSPSEIDFKTQEGRNKALRELMQSLQQGYTKDYELLIRKYFEVLRADEENK